MINFKNLILYRSPFSHLLIDDFLDVEIYQDLEKQVRAMFDNFNDLEQGHLESPDRYDKSKKRGNNLVFGGGGKDNESTQDIIEASKRFNGPINEIIKEIFSEKIQNKIYRLLRPVHLLDIGSIKPIKLHDESKKVGFVDFILYKNCYVRAKLSAYTTNSGLFQHIDHPDKVNALLLYLGFSDGVNRKGLGTQIYKVNKGQKKWSKNAGYTLDYYEEKKLTRVSDINPVPNRLFGFHKNRFSWHAVYPIDLPEGVRRDTIQINLYKHKNYSKILDSLIKSLRYIKNKILTR